MEYRRLGRSGLFISEIAYGNWVTHGAQINQDQATACVHAALNAGITTFDTADAYADTRAEAVLGDALRGVRRESFELCTKVYCPTGPGRNDRGLSRKHIMEAAHGSLHRLRTEYVDLYQAHRYDHETPLEETMLAFADLVRQGKALYIGVSEWRAEEIRAAAGLAAELHIPLVSNQPQYNLLWRIIEPEVIPTCQELGLSQIVWSPLAQGVLAGKYRPGQPPPPGSRATHHTAGSYQDSGADYIADWLDPAIIATVSHLWPIAAEANLSMAQLAIAWVLQNPNVAAAIIGASRPEQVAENTKASGVQLAQELLRRIDAIVEPHVRRDPLLTRSPNPRI